MVGFREMLDPFHFVRVKLSILLKQDDLQLKAILQDRANPSLTATSVPIPSYRGHVFDETLGKGNGGLRCKQKRKFKATTNSKHAFPVAPNLLEQTFAPTRPNEAWVSDITYVATEEGWLYLAGIKDVFTCEMVGYAMGARMTQDLTAKALWRAVRSKRPAPGLILHSDRGSQYCADDYRKLVAAQLSVL